MDNLPTRRGMLLVLSSPSGAGKTTLSRRLLRHTQEVRREQPVDMVMSISITTRAKRPGEEEAVDYFFKDVTTFHQMAGEGKLLEHAKVFDNFYGTPEDFAQGHIDAGRDVLFDIDWQGTRQLAEKRRLDLVSIFILPPSMAELRRRLTARAQDSEEVVNHRMSKAADEISHWTEYDYVLVNDSLDATLEKIIHIVDVERQKRLRQNWLPEFVAGLTSAAGGGC